MHIANLSYDTYFKYLMEDQRAARVLLGALLQCKVESVEQRKNEVTIAETTQREGSLKMFRLDFSATIVDSKGRRKAVCIELQRAKHVGDVARFRRYLGAHYKDEKLVDGHGKAIPIIAIYILGHNLPGAEFEQAVIYGNTTLKDVNGVDIEYKGGCEYIDGLSHSLIIVQLPKVKKEKKEGSILNVLLSYFEYDTNTDTIEVKDAEDYKLDAEDTRGVLVVQNRLLQAVADDETSAKLELEKDAMLMLEKYGEEKRKAEELVKKMRKLLREKGISEDEINSVQV